MNININILEVLDIYFLILMAFNSFTAFFIDASFYNKKSDLRMKLRARVLSVIFFILGIALYIAGQKLGGI
ncbi:MAG: CLC_0170 family protein [Clostridiaceae bacterium]